MNKLFIVLCSVVMLFALFSFNKNYSEVKDIGAIAKRFTDLYFSTDVSKKDLLNAEFATPMVTYDIDDNNGLILRINGRGREFTIPVPPPPFIISNEMAQSDGLYILLAAKEKIINKLIDLTYFNTFNPANGLTKNDYKYLIQDLK